MTGVVQEAAKKQRAKLEAAATARAARKSALREKVEAAREWSEEEVRMLDKGLEKFPVGVPRRWEQVTSYVRTRTQEEILFMVKVRPSRTAPPLPGLWWCLIRPRRRVVASCSVEAHSCGMNAEHGRRKLGYAYARPVTDLMVNKSSLHKHELAGLAKDESDTVVGGIPGESGCDIWRMADGFCDDRTARGCVCVCVCFKLL